MNRQCVSCGSTELFYRVIDNPIELSGIVADGSKTQMVVVVCGRCALCSQFVPLEFLALIREKFTSSLTEAEEIFIRQTRNSVAKDLKSASTKNPNS
jgi:hypothetical protein